MTAPARPPAARPLRLAFADALCDRLSRWLIRARTRRRLAELEARELADIGLSEAERRRECRKPFWRR